MSTRWLKRNSVALAILVLAAALFVALMRARRAPSHDSTQTTSPSGSASSAGGYADAASCATCHEEIARTYAATGMARGFKGSGGVFGSAPPENPSRPLFHKASNRHYTMIERDGRVFQRRHQIGFDGKETNVLELEAHYVIGSGNHARTFVHRTASGRLVQLPVSWYANEGQGARGKGQGYWEMSPGYDKAAHLDFRRVIDAGCMSCHNGYPRSPVKDDLEGPRFTGPLPEGIDCQRCHGPGRAHIDAINARDLDAARRAIVNPAKLDRERQLETCMQCHLESTSSPLPFQIRRYDQAPFSYVPGQPLGDHVIHFDHAPGTGRDDKFEINGAGYRLRKSACFQQSEMTCVTCHDPHDVPRGSAAVKRYVAICQSCHTNAHPRGVPRAAGALDLPATCLDCHMPKRRAEDAVHVVMTDHYIQRERPARNLLAARTEAHSPAAYRGDVVPYYPAPLPASPENELYLAVAQVQEGSNLSAGIRRLQQAIETHRPSHAEFYYRLARAYSRIGDLEADIRWCREALRRDAAFVPALKELADAATKTGDLAEASQALEKAVSLHPDDATALADLGNVYLQQGRLDDAERTLGRALEADPTLPPANNTRGLALLKKGRADAAETYFREAIRMQPDLAEAHNNLGNLLASRRAYDEAGFHFAAAIASNPNYVEAHHSYGLVLALTKAYAKAVTELETAIRLAPGLLPAHLDLAEVLVALGRRGEARSHFETAARSADPDVRAAALAGLRAR
ncbi:MAG TPA: tetratricopeptide repeat protein [Vicinamibacterales bacterium]|nr:tetratricopeptide repeat protein [Vicinamibacterales bacterium]